MSGRPLRDSMASVRSILCTTLPAAAAIAVFGTLYGVAARPLLGVPLTLASSLFVFSGALQFALVGLLAAAAAPPALLLTAGALNLRHLVLGAVLRPRIGGSRWRRAALAFFLVDETFGFAIAAATAAERHGRAGSAAAERTLLVSGIVCHVAWQVGTLVGVLGAGVAAVQGLAGAIFPVLFIGLASLAIATRLDLARAVVAALLTGALAFTVPEARAVAPVIAGILAALPGRAE
jgi:predicted branched-subunit amino acid permease